MSKRKKGAPARLSLREARAESGLTAREVAEAAGLDRVSLYRIEAGSQHPRRESARALFRLFAGRVPLAAIYDPEYAAIEAAGQQASVPRRRRTAAVV
jgi:DNA-binding XRE family transcriptional regulator